MDRAPTTVISHLDKSGRPTLATVAALAGVHVSTVSRALSVTVSSTVRVASPDTIQRIRQVAAEVGFSRNLYAAGLRTHQTALVGMLVPRLTDLVLATVYEGVEEEARRAGYQTFVTNTRDDDAERRRKLDMLLERRVDGILLGDARMENDELIERLERLGLPFVLTSRRATGSPSVTCDDREGGRLAARHLLDLGHRSVAVIAGEPYASTAHDRLAGFAEVYQEAGHVLNPRLVISSGFDVVDGRRASDHILSLAGDQPTAIFAVNDFAAIGALGSLRAAGHEPGRDMAVIGYNDVALAGELPLPLTSIRSPLDEMGTQAMAMLVRRIAGEATSPVLLAPTLQARESTLGAAMSN